MKGSQAGSEPSSSHSQQTTKRGRKRDPLWYSRALSVPSTRLPFLSTFYHKKRRRAVKRCNPDAVTAAFVCATTGGVTRFFQRGKKLALSSQKDGTQTRVGAYEIRKSPTWGSRLALFRKCGGAARSCLSGTWNIH